jgi:hypothetical protein
VRSAERIDAVEKRRRKGVFAAAEQSDFHEMR